MASPSPPTSSHTHTRTLTPTADLDAPDPHPSPPSHHTLPLLTATYTHYRPTTAPDPTTTHLTHPLHPCTSSPTQHPATTTLHTLHAALITLQHEINKLLTAEMVHEAGTAAEDQLDEEEAEEEEEEREDEILSGRTGL